MRIVKLGELTAEDRRRLINRCDYDFSTIEHEVASIIDRVKEKGDAEILDFYGKFLGHGVLTKEKIKVSSDEVKSAYEHVPERLIGTFKVSAENIEKFHRSQLPPQLSMYEMRKSLYAGRVVKLLDSVGTYVPGGKASYPSTALMATIPARVANVPKIITCTPTRGATGSAVVDPVAGLFNAGLIKETDRLTKGNSSHMRTGERVPGVRRAKRFCAVVWR